MLLCDSYPETGNSFYQTIIDNNLFRPLGWRPKTLPFPYRLIGTVTYNSNNKKPIAVIQETNGQRESHIVSIGDQLRDITVIDIQSKKVILDKKDKKIILRITQQYLHSHSFNSNSNTDVRHKSHPVSVSPRPIESPSPTLDMEIDQATEYLYIFRDDY